MKLCHLEDLLVDNNILEAVINRIRKLRDKKVSGVNWLYLNGLLTGYYFFPIWDPLITNTAYTL